jgi:hypothetical protein
MEHPSKEGIAEWKLEGIYAPLVSILDIKSVIFPEIMPQS